MNTPTPAAKAAAVLVFTSGIEGYDMAVKVYDTLERENVSVQDTLEKFPGVVRWSRVDDLDDNDWWEEIRMLATNIDEAQKHFKEGTTHLEAVDTPSGIEAQTQIHKGAWRLTKAGEPVVKGSVHANFRGEDATIVGGTPPHKEGAAGFVETSEGSLFYPSVFGMVWSQDLT